MQIVACVRIKPGKSILQLRAAAAALRAVGYQSRMVRRAGKHVRVWVLS